MVEMEGGLAPVLVEPIVPPRWRVAHGEALDHLRRLPDASFDAMITDPPGGLDFMASYTSCTNGPVTRTAKSNRGASKTP